MLRIVRHFLLFSAGCASVFTASAADVTEKAGQAGRVPIIDTHAHVLRSGLGNVGRTASAALTAMDENGVALTVLLPPPFPAVHKRKYGNREIAPLTRDHPGRFAVVAGGESLNGMIQSTDPARVTPADIKDFVEEAEAIARSGVAGFGEIAAEHFSSGRGGHPYESTRPDHPLLLALADVAAREGIPIDFHMEAVPQDMAYPGRASGSNPAHLKENIAAFERLLAHNRGARIVWAHAGRDLTGERTVMLMRTLLSNHPNLYMSVKIDHAGPQRTSPFNPSGDIKPGWLSMLRSFPDRFVIGSDQFFEEGTERLSSARKFVDALPADIAAAIASQNAERIYRLAPVLKRPGA